MHASISGTVDFLEEDDESCLKRLRSLVDMLPNSIPIPLKGKKNDKILSIVDPTGKKGYDVRTLLNEIVDPDSFIEYKAQYGQTLVCGMPNSPIPP